MISREDLKKVKNQTQDKHKAQAKENKDKTLINTLGKLNEAVSKLLNKNGSVDLSPIKVMIQELTKAVDVTQKMAEQKDGQINDLLEMVSALNNELISLKGQKGETIGPILNNVNQSNRAIVTGLGEIQKEMRNKVPKKWEFEVEPAGVNGYRKITAEAIG